MAGLYGFRSTAAPSLLSLSGKAAIALPLGVQLMDIHDLSPGVARRRNVEAAIWAAATLVGEARRLSNERSRQEHRDRGRAINADVDLRGAFAELYRWKWVRSLDTRAAAYIKARLLVEGATG